MKWENYIKKYVGKKIDWDGVYGVQCVDFIDHYIKNCLGIEVGYFGNAKTWWINRNNAWLKNNFNAISPTYKNGELKTGDIGIKTSGKNGHIFVIAEPNKNGYVKIYDQNGKGNGEPITLRTIKYNAKNVNGILRPKDRKNLPDDFEEPLIYGNGYIKTTTSVYCDSRLKNKIGSVAKKERVKKLGTGNGNPIIAYITASGYKCGFVKKDLFIAD